MALSFSLRLPRPSGNSNACSVEELADLSNQLLSIERAINELIDPSSEKARSISGAEALEAISKLVREYENTAKRLYECVGSLEDYNAVIEKVKSRLPVR